MQAAWPGMFGPRAEAEHRSRPQTATPTEVEVHTRAPCDAVMARLTEAFQVHGLRVYPSFDLQAALERLPQCGCPYHGQDACTCQYVVWLVYGPDAEPVLVILHGRDDETWITLSASDVHQTQVYEVLVQALNQDDGR